MLGKGLRLGVKMWVGDVFGGEKEMEGKEEEVKLWK